jgi:hypothetical protein
MKKRNQLLEKKTKKKVENNENWNDYYNQGGKDGTAAEETAAA